MAWKRAHVTSAVTYDRLVGWGQGCTALRRWAWPVSCRLARSKDVQYQVLRDTMFSKGEHVTTFLLFNALPLYRQPLERQNSNLDPQCW